MELFSEIYNCYFQVVNQILREATGKALSANDIEAIVREQGYEESVLTIVPKLLNGEWSFLEKTEQGYVSKVDNLSVTPLSRLQKSWLKSLLSDIRMRIFFTESQLSVLDEYLRDEKSLFSTEDFLYFDQYQDGDPFESPEYGEQFRLVIKAIKEHRLLKFSYLSGKHKLMEHTCLPCRIEYSLKDNKFRLLSLRSKRDGRWELEIINLGRIVVVEETKLLINDPPDLDYYLEKSLSREPVVLRIFHERNAMERTMLHFASYEKRTEKIEGTNDYLCYIYYDRSTETELLIQILSFGPVVKVLGPESFLKQVKERVRLQMERLPLICKT